MLSYVILKYIIYITLNYLENYERGNKMFKRRLFFSVLYLILSIIGVVVYDSSAILLIFIPLIPFLFYLINILKLNIPYEYELIFLIFITFGTVIGETWNAYYRFAYLDVILHCLAGPILSLVPLCLFVRNKSKFPIVTKWFLILMVSMGFAALWEVWEFTMDQVFGANMQKNEEGLGLLDTMHDIIIHLVGTGGFVIFFLIDEFKFNSKITKKIEKIMLRKTTEKEVLLEGEI